MSFYSQWIKDPKFSSVVWVCGGEFVLTDEVVERFKSAYSLDSMHFTVLDATQMSQGRLWDALWQRPIIEDSRHLTVVYGAQEIVDLTPMKSWLQEFKTSFPQTGVCFVSEADNFPECSFLKPPKVTPIRCSRLSPEDAVKWVKCQSTLSERSARLLLEHVGGSLRGAKEVCDKINRALEPSSLLVLNSDQIKAFVAESPSEFTDALMSLDRTRALASVALLSKEDRYKSVSLLELRISQMAKLQRALKHKKLTGQELSKIPGVPFPVVKDFMPVTKFYSDSRILSCRQQLTLVDHYHNQGIYEGVLESLVALW